jgi:hypothetical protein
MRICFPRRVGSINGIGKEKLRGIRFLIMVSTDTLVPVRSYNVPNDSIGGKGFYFVAIVRNDCDNSRHVRSVCR